MTTTAQTIIPEGSPAANVRQFVGAPIERWFKDRGEYHFITATGGYASVYPDDEPTDHWFGATVQDDGAFGDTWDDDPESVMAQCERMLRS